MLKSIYSTAYTGVNTKGGLVGLRFVLGLVEAGYFVSSLATMPGRNLHVSSPECFFSWATGTRNRSLRADSQSSIVPPSYLVLSVVLSVSTLDLEVYR